MSDNNNIENIIEKYRVPDDCPILLVDLDDTIENCTETWVRELNLRYGTHADPTTLTEWNVKSIFPELTYDQVYDLILEDDFWGKVRPIEGACEVLSKLKEDGVTIYFCSNTNYQIVQAKMEEMLFRYFPFADWHDVILTCHKELVKGDILIDDGPHNLVRGDYEKVLMTMPHNLHFDEKPYGIHRVSDWKEADTVIRRILKEKKGFEGR